MPTPGPAILIDFDRIRANAQMIGRRTGVDVLAVIKADAYGLGASAVAEALKDVVAGFAVFSLEEAAAIGLWQRTGKPAIALGPPQTLDPRAWIEQHVRPAVATVEQAQALRDARPILCVDTGMQRFSCPADRIDAVIAAGRIDEAFTHAPAMEHVQGFQQLIGGKVSRLHAAASSLLDQPGAWLDAVRPGLALCRDAVTVAAPLVEVHDSAGPVGYGGFTARRHGVILCGYSHGLRRGPCLINGQARRILEVGMQSAYVEAGTNDRAGDSVTLLGPGLPPEKTAAEWHCTPHEVLLRLAASSHRNRQGSMP